MKKIILSIVFSLIVIPLLAQTEFQGLAIYESKTSASEFKSRLFRNKDITPEMQKTIEQRIKTMFEKTFVLNFCQSSSIYKEQEKLDAPTQNNGGMRMMSSMMGTSGTFYKNIKLKTYTVNKEFMGKEFLVKDSLPNFDWKMEVDSKVIGGYTCFKATSVQPVSKSDFRNFKPPSNQNNEENTKSENIIKKTNFQEDRDLKQITITAWYTPEIPINQGPANYWGLPGLILEVNDGSTIILCSKIVLNSKEKVEIKEPKNGKIISQNDYDEMVVKKLEEMRQLNQDFPINGNRIPFGG